jgi:hypothetical protein
VVIGGGFEFRLLREVGGVIECVRGCVGKYG